MSKTCAAYEKTSRKHVLMSNTSQNLTINQRFSVKTQTLARPHRDEQGRYLLPNIQVNRKLHWARQQSPLVEPT
jgi:hypothetical protein